ncbi:iron ABC transporter permease [Clostridium sp. OS1-26]|uniref:ABC transporter permease n=1 Tax=Clostridium sp. OS1-26 TaxID=3070681 RepID=UPI0027E0CD83|nr:iron ABC transporter permease [Clostridium sp. OS1-26]WML37457.1 iron ABC transporter permease [Clostridium sp. OS1-26]
MKRIKFRVSILDTLIITLVVLSVLIFILYPVSTVVYKSFFPKGNFTLEFYNNLIHSNKKLIFNSLFISSFSTVFSTLIAISVAIYTSFSKPLLKKIIVFVLLLSMISPPFVSSLAYIQLFGRRGLVTYYFLRLQINPYGWQGIVMMQSLSMAALNSLMLIATIKGIDKSLLSASLDLGANINYTVKKVLIPLMKPGIIVCALLSFVRCLSDFGTPIIIGGNFNVLASEIYLKIIGYADLEYASTMNVLLLIPSLLLFMVYRFYMKKSNSYSVTSSKQTSVEDFRLSKEIGTLLAAISLLFLSLMIIQYMAILVSGFSKYSFGKFYWTLDHIKDLSMYNYSSFLRSIAYAFIAGILGSLLGGLIAYYTERRRIFGMKFIDFITTLPYIIPGTFFGIGYVLAFNDYPLMLTGTASIVVLNCIFKQLPMTTKLSAASLLQINKDIENSAKDLGAKNVFVIKDIIIPSLKPAFLVGFINNFTATMTTIGAVIFLIYPGQKIATFELFDAVTSGNYGEASLIATIIIFITLTVNILFSKLVIGGNVIANVSTIKETN